MRLRLSALSLALTCAALPLRAQTPVTLTDASGVSALGYYVGPYTGVIGTGPTAQSLFMTCVDLAHESAVGETWNALLTNLGTGDGIGVNTRSADLTLYRQAAWLSTQFAGRSAAEIGDIHATIWNLFDASAPDPSSSFWLTQAQANYASLDYSGFYVVTDVNKELTTSAQEFIITTPEPASLLLLGTGLAGVFGSARRRRRDG